jgi:hypothetical protein
LEKVKHIRSYKKKGCTLSWFLKLEEKVLKKLSSRKVQDVYKVKSLNRTVIRALSRRISEDKRKKE